MNVASSSQLELEQRSQVFDSTIENPRLTNMDPASMRLILLLYNQYVRELQERARQLIVEGELSKIASRAVQLKYCVDIE